MLLNACVATALRAYVPHVARREMSGQLWPHSKRAPAAAVLFLVLRQLQEQRRGDLGQVEELLAGGRVGRLAVAPMDAAVIDLVDGPQEH